MKDPPLYYPVQKGARWVYLQNGTEFQYEVSDVKKSKRGDGDIVTVVQVEGEKRTLYRKMEVSRRGLLWLETVHGDAFDEPIRMLRCPAVAKDDWPYRSSGSGGIGQCQGTMKVIGTEEVEVPAGKYNAVHVEDESWIVGGPDKKHRCHHWFAPGVGLVKADYGTEAWVLKSFVPGP